MDNHFFHPLEKIAHKWLVAFNNHDIENLLALYDENAKHYSPKLKVKHPTSMGYIVGKPALRLWWQSAFESLPDLKYVATSLTANDDRIFMEYIRKVPDEQELLVAEVLEIKNNLIVASRVYHG